MNLSPKPATDYVVPYFLRGPLDGGFGMIEPAHSTSGHIKRAGGRYELIGFHLSSDFVRDVTIAMVTPDRAIYQWESDK